MKDPIIDEVWKAKDAIATRHNHNIRQLVEHLREQQKSSQAPIVDLRAQRVADQTK